MKGLGLHSSFGIDHALKASRRGPVIQLDLLKSSHQSLLLQWLSSELLVSVWFAPPCGTASRAREIPMSPSEHGPPPLRTSDSPDGVSSLSAKELERVQKANCLYSFTTMCCLHLSQLSKPWVVENPSRSLYWDTSFWQDVHELCQPDYFQFHACMHGGRRRKCTTLACFQHPAMFSLAVSCDNQHEHEPWGVITHGERQLHFATADEATYPVLLCQRAAKLSVL